MVYSLLLRLNFLPCISNLGYYSLPYICKIIARSESWKKSLLNRITSFVYHFQMSLGLILKESAQQVQLKTVDNLLVAFSILMNFKRKKKQPKSAFTDFF